MARQLTPTAEYNQPKVASSLAEGDLRWYALAFLVILAPCFPEFLTGSTPILAAVFSPPAFAVLVGLYGGGALLIRETTVRWGKRWTGVLLLGGAYAIGEEGFAAKTMTDPTGSNIGDQLYTHWAGINWVPLSGFIVFHAVFSIAFLLLVVELLFPGAKGRRLLGNVGVGITMVAYGLAIVLLSSSEPFTLPIAVTVFLAGLALAFIMAAYFVRGPLLQARGERPDRPELRFILAGAGMMGAFFLNITLGSHFLPWPVSAALFPPLAALPAWYMVKHAGRTENDRPKVAFALGMALVFVPLDILGELGGNVGVLAFTAFTLALLVWLRRRTPPIHLEPREPVLSQELEGKP